MNLFLEQAKLIDPENKYHNQQINILIKNGKIEALGKSVSCPKGVKKMDLSGAYISAGWIDVGTQIGEPGLEHRENLQSVAKAAMQGGYTALACFPNTNPPLHSKSEIQFVKNNTQESLVDFYPIGAITANCEGNQIAEMIDMDHVGAVAFSDGNKPMQNSKILNLALEYTKSTNSLIINRPHDDLLANEGLIHEGPTSMSLGCVGVSDLSEKVALDRDLSILAYTQGKLISHLISTSESVNKIKSEKKKNTNLWASVAYLNLVKTEADLADFNVNLKVQPVLRAEKDQKALIKGIKEGVIDIISSNHEPIDEESKDLEFSTALFGAAGLQTCFSALNTSLQGLVEIETIVNCLSHNPRRILGLDKVEITKDSPANFTIFNKDEKWLFEANNNKSKSKNNPFLNQEMTGRVLGVINKNKSWFLKR